MNNSGGQTEFQEPSEGLQAASGGFFVYICTEFYPHEGGLSPAAVFRSRFAAEQFIKSKDDGDISWWEITALKVQ